MMRKLFRPAIIKKQYLVALAILLLVYTGCVFCSAFGTLNHGQQPIPNNFIGSASCQKCHPDIYESHVKTAHYRTSRPGVGNFIKGSFDSGNNTFRYNKFMQVLMTKTDSGFYQSAYLNGELLQAEKMDMVIGSGRKGQTYGYWNGDSLYELPISYYTPQNSWCNSPGYIKWMVNFKRPINAHCIECHGTYVKALEVADGATIYDRSSIIYGVDCERCHGPAADHAAFHEAHPAEKKPMYIVQPQLLTRQQRLDACALCHSGPRTELQPAFSFKGGDKLDDFSKAVYNADSAAGLDVHGNQFGLLTASKCFKSSAMDCSSCHNTHVEEVNQPKLFSQRCINCHTYAAHNVCTLPPVKGLVLANDCISCHMPLMASKKIFLQMDDPSKSTADLVRTHRVAIYPVQTKEFLKKMGFK